MNKKQRANWPFLVSAFFHLCVVVGDASGTDRFALSSISVANLVGDTRFVCSKEFLSDIGISVFRVFSAFILAFVIAIPLALLMTEFAFVKRLLEPYIDFIRYLPVPALIPLTILFFGLGEGSKIALLFIGTFFNSFFLLLMTSTHSIEILRPLFSLGFSRMRGEFLGCVPFCLSCTTMPALRWDGPDLPRDRGTCCGPGRNRTCDQRGTTVFQHRKVYVAILTLGIIGLVIDQVFKRLYPVASFLTESMIEVTGLKKRMIQKSREARRIERHFFSCKKGEFVCIVGSSGSGKSTLLRCLSGMDTDCEGEVRIDGETRDRYFSQKSAGFVSARVFQFSLVNGLAKCSTGEPSS